MNQMIVSLLNTLGLKSDPQTSVVFRNTVEAITQPQLDAISPTPFAMSVSGQFELGDGIQGFSFMLDEAPEVPIGQFAPGGIVGLVFYLDILRGSYWGDITISCTHPETLESSIAKTTVDQTECNSLVTLTFLEAPEVDDEIVITVTASGGGHSITRTLTVNVVADPEE